MPKPPTHIRMVHPLNEDREWDCPVRYADRARAKGWKPVGEPGPYDGLSKSELEDAIDSRNADLPEAEHLSKSGNKADLVATLIADDGRRS